MKTIEFKELKEEEQEYIITEMLQDWQQLTPTEARLPFKSNVKETMNINYDKHVTYCATHEHIILGCFTLRPFSMHNFGIKTPDSTIWLMDVFVIPRYRSNGVGSWMVNEAKRIAKELGYHHMYVQCKKSIKPFFDNKDFLVEYTLGANYGFPATNVMSHEIKYT